MSWMASFLDAYFAHINFVYGLSFFAMGLALWVESRRTSELRLAGAVRLLALFGLLHSAHEFAAMFSAMGNTPTTAFQHGLQAGLLAISFLPLLAFGIYLLPYTERRPGFTVRATILAIIAFGMQVVLVGTTYHPSPDEWIQAVHTLARYTIGMPAAVLAALGLFRQRRSLLENNLASFGHDITLAAVAFIWYGLVGQAFPISSIIFPSMYINAEVFREWFGVPIELVRAAMAMVVAIAMIRALRAFEEEDRRRLGEAQQTERQLKIAVRELALLYEASHLLTAMQDLDPLIQEAIDRIIQIIEPIKNGMIYVPDHETGEDHCAYCGTPEAAAECKEIANRAGKSGIEVYSQWFDKEGRDVTSQIVLLPTDGVQSPNIPLSRVILPLKTRQRIVGSLLIETAGDGPYLSSLEAQTIIVLARQLAIAVENAQLVLQLRERDSRRAELLQRATAAQEAERKRVARELHDVTGQALTALAIGLKGMTKLVARNPEKAASQFEQLQSISTDALEELRHLISDLRPSHLDDLGLVAALRWYVEQVSQRSDVIVSFSPSGEAYRLPPEMETTLFRIAQEALNNVIKHAAARHAHLSLDYQSDCLNLRIEDDGRGFEASAVLRPGAGRAWGLIGIQERVALAGGKVVIHSEPSHGTTILVSVPAPGHATALIGQKERVNESH